MLHKFSPLVSIECKTVTAAPCNMTATYGGPIKRNYGPAEARIKQNLSVGICPAKLLAQRHAHLHSFDCTAFVHTLHQSRENM